MHHHRLHLTGPAPAVAVATQWLARRGAVVLPSDRRDTRTVVRAHERGLDLAELSSAHPLVAFGVEHFIHLGDERRRCIAHGGTVDVLEIARFGEAPHKGGLALPEQPDLVPVAFRPASELPIDPAIVDLLEGMGSYHEEDGEPLPRGSVRAAADRVLEAPVPELPGGGAHGELLRTGSVLGSWCEACERYEEPEAPLIETLVKAAAWVLAVAGRQSGVSDGELRMQRSWIVTHVAATVLRNEFDGGPGRASWRWWSQLVAASLAELIDVTSHLDPFDELYGDDPDREDRRAAAAEHRSPRDHAQLGLHSTLVTCFEALALFAAPPVADSIAC